MPLSRNNKASIVTLIVDYDAGNLASVKRACQQVGLAAEFCADPDRLRHAERVIFPGVGAAGSAMVSVKERGLDEALREVISNGCPVLGICLGMQISLDHSEENDTSTLGLIEGNVTRFRMDRPDLKVPHMGWNRLSKQHDHRLLAGVDEGAHVYFVHSYFVPVTAQTIAATNYGDDFTEIVAENNFMGCQFHPEKSGLVGAQILRNFLEMPS